MGCPIRTSTDQSLLAAPHGFSQRATSFIASWCQGIHRMPLSRSIRVSLSSDRPLSHHAQEPSSTNLHRRPREWPLHGNTRLLYSALIQTPLTTIASSGWTTLGCKQPRSLPVRQMTQHHDGPTLPRSKPTPLRQPNHNRVVLRAQRRTRTRFTTQKNNRQALAQRQHGMTMPPHALGGRHRQADRGTNPMKHSTDQGFAPNPTKGQSSFGNLPPRGRG